MPDTAASAALCANGSLPQIARFNPLNHAGCSLAVRWLIGWMLLRCMRMPSAQQRLYTVLLVLIFAGGVYDRLLNAIVLPALLRQRFYVTHLMVPLVLAIFVAHLARRVVASVQGVRAANEGLETRVAAGERERNYHDLHDSLGARLLTLVHSAPDVRQAELRAGARRCLMNAPPQVLIVEDLPASADWLAPAVASAFGQAQVLRADTVAAALAAARRQAFALALVDLDLPDTRCWPRAWPSMSSASSTSRRRHRRRRYQIALPQARCHEPGRSHAGGAAARPGQAVGIAS